MIHDTSLVAARARRLAVEGTVEAIDGSVLALHPQTLCIHGDTPGAAALAVAVRTALIAAGVTVAAVART